MTIDINRLVSAILHLREASENLKSINPELSLLLLQTALTLASKNGIKEDVIKDMDDTAKEIAGETRASC